MGRVGHPCSSVLGVGGLLASCFLSRWGGGKSFLESQKESNMRKLSEFVKETCLEF